MSNDDALPNKLKGLLLVSEVVTHFGVTLERSGRKYKAICPFHTVASGEREKTPSFNVDDARGSFKCFGCGKGGDLLTFIKLATRCDDFIENLKVGCALANLDFEAERGGDPGRISRGRQIGDILTAYMQLGKTLWTPSTYAQARQRKSYLTEDVIERWDLGVAPTVAQCERAGLSREQLRMVGLLRPSRHDDTEYMHFYDSILIPHVKNGRCVYLADRALNDFRGKDGKKKILNMPLPEADGTGGVPMPAHFNLEAMWSERAREVGVLLVEARLDAIACCERGHPAVAFLSSPTPAFAAELAKYPGVRMYYAPDGTADMTPMKRAEAAGLLGYDVKCCRLPAGTDPDDLSNEQLAGVKAAAGDCVEEWFGALEGAA